MIAALPARWLLTVVFAAAALGAALPQRYDDHPRAGRRDAWRPARQAGPSALHRDPDTRFKKYV